MKIERKPKKTPVASSEAGGHEVDVSPIQISPKQTARKLNVSLSWLAKRRADGDGPPFVKLGRAVRYPLSSLEQWVKIHQRISTGG
jgi:predicted DNA-binding transcriptional regulator AlpA